MWGPPAVSHMVLQLAAAEATSSSCTICSCDPKCMPAPHARLLLNIEANSNLLVVVSAWLSATRRCSCEACEQRHTVKWVTCDWRSTSVVLQALPLPHGMGLRPFALLNLHIRTRLCSCCFPDCCCMST